MLLFLDIRLFRLCWVILGRNLWLIIAKQIRKMKGFKNNRTYKYSEAMSSLGQDPNKKFKNIHRP